MQIEVAQCGDVSLCLGVAGEGPELLFIGGTGWDLRKTPNPLTSALVSKFRVALFDQRGQGRSDKPPGPYSMEGYAADALAVADHLGWDRPAIAGYSFGGMVAQEYATRYPNRLSKLILAASTPGGAGGSSYPVEEFLHLPPEDRARRGLEISDMRFPNLQKANPEAAAKLMARRVAYQTLYADEPGARSGLEAQLAARARHDCYDRLGQITAPTLVLAGLHDGQAPLVSQNHMAERIPNAHIVTLPGAHNFLFENDAGYDEIARFLKD